MELILVADVSNYIKVDNDENNMHHTYLRNDDKHLTIFRLTNQLIQFLIPPFRLTIYIDLQLNKAREYI